MDTSKEAQGKRLKRAREQRYQHATEAADALGLPHQTYLPYESGRTGFTRHATRFAAFFGVNLLWLLTGEGAMRPKEVDPILDLYQRIPAEKRDQAIEYLEFLSGSKK